MSTSILIDTFDALIGELPRLATMAMQEERQKVVALLRAPIDGVIEEACLVAADMIERGDHLKEVTND